MNTDHSTQSLTTSSDSQEQPQQLIIDASGKQNLITTAKWSNFIAIVGIVMVVFFALIGIAIMFVSPIADDYQDFQSLPSLYFTFIGIFYLIMAVIYFFLAIIFSFF